MAITITPGNGNATITVTDGGAVVVPGTGNATAQITDGTADISVTSPTVSVGVGGSSASVSVSSGSVDLSVNGGSGQSSVITITAAENISASDLVYLNVSGQALKADANSAVKEAIGFAQSAITSGASGPLNFGSGIITGFIGLTPGARYFLSTTPGEITTTKPTGSADIVQQVGFAISTTQLYFEPQPAILLV